MSGYNYELCLWENCNNKCKFCFLDYKKLSHQQRIDAIEHLPTWMDSLTPDSNLLLIGGELYDSSVYQLGLISIYQQISKLMASGTIKIFTTNSNLMYRDLGLLRTCIEIIRLTTHEQFNQRFAFTTSYDIGGTRFFTPEREKLFLDNLEVMPSLIGVNDVNVNVNMILTKPLCHELQKYGQCYIDDFERQYHCHVMLLPYFIKDPSLAVTRREMLQTLTRLDSSYVLNWVYAKLTNNTDKRRVFKYNPESQCYEEHNAGILSCGHGKNFIRCYSDSDRCFLCDVKAMLGV